MRGHPQRVENSRYREAIVDLKAWFLEERRLDIVKVDLGKIEGVACSARSH